MFVNVETMRAIVVFEFFRFLDLEIERAWDKLAPQKVSENG